MVFKHEAFCSTAVILQHRNSSYNCVCVEFYSELKIAFTQQKWVGGTEVETASCWMLVLSLACEHLHMHSDSCERIPGKDTNTSVEGMVIYSLLQYPFWYIFFTFFWRAFPEISIIQATPYLIKSVFTIDCTNIHLVQLCYIFVWKVLINTSVYSLRLFAP